METQIMKTEEKVTAAAAGNTGNTANATNAADIDDSERISSLISTLRKRHRKNISARKKKLDKMSKKYAGMTIAEINEHNMKMIDRRDDLIDRRDDAL